MAAYGRQMGMGRSARILTAVLAIAVAVALALMIVPVQATYLNDVGSDTVEYRTASCGTPVASILGAEPGLGGGSEFPIGGDASKTSCEAASGRRVIGALVLLLGASAGWSRLRRRWRVALPRRLTQDAPA